MMLSKTGEQTRGWFLRARSDGREKQLRSCCSVYKRDDESAKGGCQTEVQKRKEGGEREGAGVAIST